MSHRSMTTKNGMIGVKTSNGTETFTASVYAKGFKEYNHPLENGFNLELAQDVYETIEANQKLWSQGNWRVIRFGDNKDSYPAIRSALAFTVDPETPVCGTAMCFAGWVKELTQADWVIDGNCIKKAMEAHTPYFPGGINVGSWGDFIVARKEPGVFYQPGMCLEIRALPEFLQADLKDRGFSNETHYITMVEQAARRELGIGNDPLHLFGASNSMDRIKATIGYYAEHGAHMSLDERDAFFDMYGDSEDDYNDDEDED